VGLSKASSRRQSGSMTIGVSVRETANPTRVCGLTISFALPICSRKNRMSWLAVVRGSYILMDITGSDHCPVVLERRIRVGRL
jgi:hypothetical protein